MSEHEMKGDVTYQKIVTRAWTDPKFKAQLLADPHRDRNRSTRLESDERPAQGGLFPNPGDR